MTAIPAWLVWHQMSNQEIAMLALVSGLSALGQFCSVRAYAAGELLSIAPIDYSQLVFAGVIGFLVFAEVLDRYTLVGAAIIVGSTLYIAYREAYLSRLQRASLAAKSVAQRPDDVVREAAVELPTKPLRLRV